MQAMFGEAVIVRKVLTHILGVAALASRAFALTPEQAQNLSTPELARQVLGEMGGLVVKVRRPAWPTFCRGICRTASEEELRKPPPLRLGLDFYLQPTAIFYSGPRWTGLCETRVVSPSFDDDGTLTGVGMSSRYGVTGPMDLQPEKIPDPNFVERMRAENRDCAVKWTFEKGFFADSSASAYYAVVAATLFSRESSHALALGITIKCSGLMGLCSDKDRNSEIARRITPVRMRDVNQVTCDKSRRPLIQMVNHTCFQISLENDGEYVFIEMDNTNSDKGVVLKSVEYSQNNVVY